jgi:sucrose-6-phosphate hydrolase SacC (GH32 family)
MSAAAVPGYRPLARPSERAAVEPSAPLRSEAWRPQYHFSPRKRWMGDPCGLLFHNGEYHLFFQYNPFGDQWGHASWGHAVSEDLLHWQELPVAIADDERASIFPGSVVVDERNCAGFGAGAWVAIYTGCAGPPDAGLQAQELAYSTDGGRSWTKYAHNPVLDLGMHEFRAPKVFRHAGIGRWVMLAVLPRQRCVVFFTSHDLKSWSEASRFAAPTAGDERCAWESPDLLELPVHGEPNRWVLKIDIVDRHDDGLSDRCGTRLFFGRFDGEVFVADTRSAPAGGARAEYSADFHAAMSCPGLPGRAVWMARMNHRRYARQVPTRPWRGSMTLPRDLSLVRGADGHLRLRQEPVSAVRTLRRECFDQGGVELDVGRSRALLPRGADGRALEIHLGAIEPEARWQLQLRLGPDETTRVGYDHTRGLLFVDRARSGWSPEGDAGFVARREAPCAPPRRLRVWVDWASIEVFADAGDTVITEQVFPGDASRAARLFAVGGSVRIGSVCAWTLDSARLS